VEKLIRVMSAAVCFAFAEFFSIRRLMDRRPIRIFRRFEVGVTAFRDPILLFANSEYSGRAEFPSAYREAFRATALD